MKRYQGPNFEPAQPGKCNLNNIDYYVYSKCIRYDPERRLYV